MGIRRGGRGRESSGQLGWALANIYGMVVTGQEIWTCLLSCHSKN